VREETKDEKFVAKDKSTHDKILAKQVEEVNKAAVKT